MRQPYCSKIFAAFLFLVVLVTSQQVLQKNLFFAEQSKRLTRYEDMISYVNLFLNESEPSQYNPKVEDLIFFTFEQLNSMIDNDNNIMERLKSIQEENQSELKKQEYATLFEYQQKIIAENEKRYLDLYTSISQSFKSEEEDIRTNLFKLTYMPAVLMKMHKMKSQISGEEISQTIIDSIRSQYEKAYEVSQKLLETTDNLCFDVEPLRTTVFYGDFLIEYGNNKQLGQQILNKVFEVYLFAVLQEDQELVCLKTDVYNVIFLLTHKLQLKLSAMYN